MAGPGWRRSGWDRFLGEIPLLLDIRQAADAGTPIVAAAPDSAAARRSRRWRVGSGRRSSGSAAGRSSGPRIVIN